MNFSTVYRLTSYTMLVFAALVLSVGASDGKMAMLFPTIVAVAGVTAYLTVDRQPGSGVSRLFSDLLAVLGSALAIYEWSSDSNILLQALGHWLIYLEIVLFFRSKTATGDWYMFFLGLFQVMLGSVISTDHAVGTMLFIWAILALIVLGLASLEREAVRAKNLLMPESGEPEGELYPGLIDVPFVFAALRVTLTTLTLGGVIFLAMPRQSTSARSRGGEAAGQHLTGFDDEVQLGQMGEILENDSVVMSIELFDEKGDRTTPLISELGAEPLWRGVTMGIYEKGRWFRQAKRSATFPLVPPNAVRNPDPSRPHGYLRQQIKIEANDSSVLFGLRPMMEAVSSRKYGTTPELNSIDGSIYRSDSRSGTFDYEVRSYRDSELPQPGETAPSPYRKNLLLTVPEPLKSRLKTIADRILDQRLSETDRDNPKAKARALEYWLRDSGEFAYTLKLDLIDLTIDPVEDFLVNRKEGHCEYFASALALLLRSVDIPSRVVNGFKGGDWNDIAKVMSVRQKHAHSWVEAFTGLHPGPERVPNWLILDPTPGNERDRSVAQVGGFKTNFRQITDLIRYIWVFYIVGYNAERQNKLLYGPIRALVREAENGFKIMGTYFQTAVARVRAWFHFENMQSFISFRGFLVSFIALLILVTITRFTYWLLKRLLRRFWGEDSVSGAMLAGAAHYRRFALLMSDYCQERSASETQKEFAMRATQFLIAQGSLTESVVDVPSRVVEAFYRVRFGQRELSDDALGELDSRLDALEARLKASQA